MRIVLTGAASGLGKEIAKIIPATHLICIDKVNLPQDLIQERVLTKDGGILEFKCCDLSNVDWIRSPEILNFDQHFPLDFLINCAGENHISYLQNLDSKTWDYIMNVNVRAPCFLTKRLLPNLILCQGSVVNVISNAAFDPMTATIPYCASKAALLMLTKQLSRELTKMHDVNVWGIAPNKLIDTEMSRYVDRMVPIVRGWDAKETSRQYKASHLRDEEIDPAKLAKFIVDTLPHSRHLSGCIIPYGV